MEVEKFQVSLVWQW